MSEQERQGVRAVLLTENGVVLLMKYDWGPRRQIWITPGGGLAAGESPQTALARELREETGIHDVQIGPELWTRRASFVVDGRCMAEFERFFLVRTERFEATATLMEEEERRWFRAFRWWPIERIIASSAVFAPRRLGELLRELHQHGPPPTPLDSGI
jgi:8-oxo-dGTP pyrophosphatase MutT (NUDIX family)